MLVHIQLKICLIIYNVKMVLCFDKLKKIIIKKSFKGVFENTLDVFTFHPRKNENLKKLSSCII
jgi:hypothetical protein